jgi:hypothetical protein
MIGISAVLHLISSINIMPSMNTLLQESTIALENMAIWLNLYAMAYVANACPYYGTKKCQQMKHKVCRRKLVRISVWTVMIISMLVTILGRVVINPLLTSYIYQLLMVAVIIWTLFKYRKFGIYLYIAYAAYALSIVAQIINYFISCTPIYQLGLGFQSATIIIMVSEVVKLINREED